MADPLLTPPPTTKIQDVITAFRPTKHFKTNNPVSYTSIDHDDSGEFLLLSRTDDTIQMYNTKAGAPAKELKSQKYGSALARFTHHSQSIIYASTKGDDAIRYLSMHDNNFIRYFRGHTARVTSLNLSPSGDQFMSSSLDGTVKLWDHRSSSAQGELRFEDPWLTAYDPSSTVFAVASPTAQAVVLYDLKNFDKPPFATFDLADMEKRYVHLGQRPAEGWTGLEFGNNGKFLLITTSGGGHYLLDAFSGELVHYLQKVSNGSGSGTPRLAPGDPLSDPTAVYTQADACLSPDGRFVLGGNGTQTGLLVWDSQDSPGADKVLKPSADLPSAKAAAVVAYNPRFNLVASADKDVLLWAPDTDL